MHPLGGRFRAVLVVDDDETILAAFGRSIARTGLDVYTAADTATAACLAQRYSPGLAIVDLRLGRESGLDVIQRLRREHDEMYIVVLSGYATVESTVAAMRAGAHDVMIKPATWAEIARRVGDGAPAREPIELPTLARVQWEYVQRVLSECNGNVSMTARKLGMYRATLQRWLRRQPPRA